MHTTFLRAAPFLCFLLFPSIGSGQEAKEKTPSVDELIRTGQYKKIKTGKEPHQLAAWAFARYYLTPDKEVAVAAKTAHQAGDPLGTFVLLLCHRNGTGVVSNRTVADQLKSQLLATLKKVEKPSALQEWMLGHCQVDDIPPTQVKEPGQATEIIQKQMAMQEKHWKKAAALGMAQAIQYQARHQEKPGDALKLYLKAGDMGLAEAKRYAGLYLVLGRGVEKDTDRGLKLSEDAAEAGDVYAMVNLAMFYFRGIGVTRSGRQSRQWAERALASGHWYGQIEVGYAMRNNIYGYTPETKGGFEQLKQALATGKAEVLFFLANAYRQGFGIEKNPERAVLFARAAYRQGSTPAAMVLATLYKSGDGAIKADEKKALFWTREGTARGSAVALLDAAQRKAFWKSLDAIDPMALKIEAKKK